VNVAFRVSQLAFVADGSRLQHMQYRRLTLYDQNRLSVFLGRFVLCLFYSLLRLGGEHPASYNRDTARNFWKVKRTRNRKTGKFALTAKEQAFVKAYVRDPNAVKAARAAGYQSVLKVASQVMRRPLVAAEIERRQKLLREKEEFSLEELFDWSCFGAIHDGASIIDKEKFEILHPSKWPDQRQRRLIDSVKMTTRGEGPSKVSTIEVKFAARHQFFDRIALLMGVSKKIDLKVEDGGRTIPLSVIDAITAK
jgi:phage terminase small subunit